MKKHIKFLVVLIVFAFEKVTHAQNYQWDWAHHGGGTQFFSNNSGSYFWYERVLDIAVDSNNNYYYLITYAEGNPNYDGNNLLLNSLNGIYVLSTSCDGTFRWDKEIGSSFTDFGYAIDVDANNNIYVSGYQQGLFLSNAIDPFWDTDFNLNSSLGASDPGPHNRTSYLIKYNNLGTYQWIKFPDNGMLTGAEVATGFRGRQVQVDSNGTSHWLGSIGPGTHVDGNVTVPNTVDREWKVIRYDTNGVYQGHTDINYTGDFNDYNFNFAYDPLLNRYYFSNIKNGSSSDLIYRGNILAGNAFIVAIDGVTGNDVWIYDASNALGMEIHDIEVDDNSNVYFTGRSVSSSPIGTSIFAGYSFDQVTQSGLGGANGTYVIALDSAGNLLWGNNSDTFTFNALGLTINGNEVAVATAMDDADTWDGIQAPYGGVQADDPAVVRLNKTTGVAISIEQIEGTSGQFDELTAIATDNFGNYVVGGYMKNSLFLNDPNVPMITKNGNGADFFMARLAKTDCNGVPLSNEEVKEQSFKIFPNPASDFITITSSQAALIVSYKLYSISGQLVQEGQPINRRVDISNLTTEIYLMQVRDQDGILGTLKLVKE
jgi:hypothetical protein